MLNVLASLNTSGMLLKLMAPERAGGLVDVRVAHPMSSLYSGAKTLLQVRNEAVAPVLNADSTEPAMAERAVDETAEVIGRSAGAAPLRILAAVPALERSRPSKRCSSGDPRPSAGPMATRLRG